MTRDRVSYDADWAGRAFTVVDTGGWDPDARGLAERIAGQAEIAVSLADAVLFVVDATVGITDADEAVVKILRRSKKPVVLAANKVDDARTEAEAYALWNLGLGEPYAVSALHGRGSGDLLDAVLAALPEAPPESDPEVGGPRRIAIVGKPNVGKSSLLNRLAGSERVVVDNVAGTTVDPVDELVELGGRTWRFIDTAGIRKRVKEASGHEYYASLRTSTAIDRAEVAVLVVDAGESLSEQDLRILQTVREAGRALVIAFNKWDLVDEERRYYLEREIERDLVQVRWAPRINVTARTGWHVDRLVPALDKAIEGWETRIGTGALNSFLGRLVAEHPHPVRSGKQPKILFGTQADDRAADVRAVHQRQAGGVVRAVRRAPAARGVRLRRHPDRAAAAAAGEAEALMSDPRGQARDPRATDSSTHWESVWASKGRESVSWYEESPDTSTALVLSDGVPRTVIDVGAGASMLPDALLDAGVGHVTLLDLSMSALALTAVRLDERATRVTTIVGDVLTAGLDEQYDVWHDRAVFHFLVERRAAGGVRLPGAPRPRPGWPARRRDLRRGRPRAVLGAAGGPLRRRRAGGRARAFRSGLHPRRDPSGRAPHALGRRAAVHLGGPASGVTANRAGRSTRFGTGGRARVGFWTLDRRSRASTFGLWRSLVAHLTGGQGVAGSNPVSPTSVSAGQRPSSAWEAASCVAVQGGLTPVLTAVSAGMDGINAS